MEQLALPLDDLAELPGIGHYPPLEDAQAVADHDLRFLASAGNQSSS